MHSRHPLSGCTFNFRCEAGVMYSVFTLYLYFALRFLSHQYSILVTSSKSSNLAHVIALPFTESRHSYLPGDSLPLHPKIETYQLIKSPLKMSAVIWWSSGVHVGDDGIETDFSPKLFCFWDLSTRDLLRDDPRASLRRQVGPPRKCHLRWRWTRRGHVFDRRSLRWKCRSWDHWSWPLGGHRCYLYFCRHLFYDMGS